jgi:hypothetical protein
MKMQGLANLIKPSESWARDRDWMLYLELEYPGDWWELLEPSEQQLKVQEAFG